MADQPLEAEALDYIQRIDEMGGMVGAIEKGYPQREIAASAYRFQRQLEQRRAGHGRRERAMSRQSERRIPPLRIDEMQSASRSRTCAKVKAERDAARVRAALAAVRERRARAQNLMPPIIAAAKAYATQQEICDVLARGLGTYTDPAEF